MYLFKLICSNTQTIFCCVDNDNTVDIIVYIIGDFTRYIRYNAKILSTIITWRYCIEIAVEILVKIYCHWLKIYCCVRDNVGDNSVDITDHIIGDIFWFSRKYYYRYCSSYIWIYCQWCYHIYCFNDVTRYIHRLTEYCHRLTFTK